MGDCFSSDPDSSKDKNMTRELNQEKRKDKAVKKLLFLGAGGSGKSTLFKQLRNIHGSGFGADDRRAFADHICAQILEQMKLVLETMEMIAEETLKKGQPDDFKLPDDFDGLSKIDDPEARAAADTVLSVKDPKLSQQTADAVKLLWQQACVKDIYDRRAETGIDDTAAYFWDKIDEVMASGFVPDETDILYVRYRTTGVIDQKFTIKKNHFHVFDVGGQKSERKKWIHCFDNVTAVIFVASLSCYDERMFEDQEKNSMSDQLELFDKICNEPVFQKTSMILFMNKKDLFAEKLNNGREITLCPDFETYKGAAESYEETTGYIKEVFTSKNTSLEKNVFVHLTCATDQNNVTKVFNDVQHIIIENSLMSAGLMGDFGGDDEPEQRPNAQTDSNTLLVSAAQ